MRMRGCSGSVQLPQPGKGPGELASWEMNQETGEGVPRLSPKCSGTCYRGLAPSSPRPPPSLPGTGSGAGRARPHLPEARGTSRSPHSPGPGPTALTSSLCVDGHFFRRRPQLSRFPVCRCRVLARARSAPAARLSVPMAAAALKGVVGETGERRGRGGGGLGRRRPRRARCPRPERRARGCRLRAATARCVRSGPRRPGGDREAVPEGGAGADGRCGFGGHRRQEGAVSWKTMTKQKPKPRKCFVTVTRPAAAQGRGAEGRRGAGPRVTGPRPAAGVAPGERGAGGRRRGERSARKGAPCRPEGGARPTAPAPRESSRPPGSRSDPQPMAAALRLSARPLD